MSNKATLVEDAVVLLCTTVLAATLLWLCVCTVVCVSDRLRGHPQTGGLLRPHWVRVAVVVALGSTALSTPGPSAGAGAGAGAGRRDVHVRVLDGLPAPDRAYGGVRLHVVRSGESLWAIAGQGWPRLHRLNRDRLGADPDLVHPGTWLRVPPNARPATRPTRGASR